ncbi:Heme d1 biosynthesis protein NirD / Heme d1 biosynthesis protein NirL [Thioalkalivibrio nitratireducens DSM 14787]|uniref:siroheme decarboxylase n=1 Tax=Thioalkalivibrio nitratireducens (strain DSM 14787 / UNIQEM 213 / ALEN2) TaxID=1255043 RepID=L0DY57_THIND|nr:Lrp/AsnC family transcriptional regulator [Thioalkalivibrio nitratireducens]AGA33311.1 Heme d1 biosynthesis protein NirD / Heme d1 biosynthesis protein NirL [Thioalkalivibrio nitratireducens DSM 14787]
MDVSDLRTRLQRIRGDTVPLAAADIALIGAIEKGLPLVSRPYAAVAEQLGISEAQVLERLAALRERGVIKRMGVVVRHRELGYRANGMVVWDVPDDAVAGLGQCFSRYDFVTLCYRRPRQLPEWPYNLFCMIHGKSHDEVHQGIARLVRECGLQRVPHEVLFSRRRFKQRGARYHCPERREPPHAPGEAAHRG